MKHLAMLLLLPILASPAEADRLDLRTTLSSPMVNWSVYQNGAVRRTRDIYDRWLVTCDEITDLKQKYCSLRSLDTIEDGRPRVFMDVSTGDNGAPVALIHLPLGTSLAYGVKLRPVRDPTKADTTQVSRAEAQRLEISHCGPTECLAVWSLSRPDIASLLKGEDVSLGTCSPGNVPLVFETDLKRKSCQVKAYARISALGFNHAVEASLR